LTFTYEEGEPPALDGVSLEIPAGKVTALVGPSGAGKSTLIKLLFRFYEPGSGEILIDDDRLADLQLATWRDGIALVSQDVQLFNASVADNIRYGRPDATDDEVVAAATRADAHGFISGLPHRYDTLVGDLGVRLSGGQKQRVTLARAIVRDPELLILDEATNALDSRSERVIQDALDNLSENRTVIMIAHRFSTIQRADHVIVFEDGKVSEAGDRATLLARDGLFRRLTEIQNATEREVPPS
jgi:subfamily B ATP-binding cassette protein MsbA